MGDAVPFCRLRLSSVALVTMSSVIIPREQIPSQRQCVPTEFFRQSTTVRRFQLSGFSRFMSPVTVVFNWVAFICITCATVRYFLDYRSVVTWSDTCPYCVCTVCALWQRVAVAFALVIIGTTNTPTVPLPPPHDRPADYWRCRCVRTCVANMLITRNNCQQLHGNPFELHERHAEIMR